MRLASPLICVEFPGKFLAFLDNSREGTTGLFIDAFGNSIPQFGRTTSSYSCCKGVISTMANSSLYHADQINKPCCSWISLSLVLEDFPWL
jgi:hypothetical protein